MPLCLRKTEEKSKDGSSSNKKNKRRKNESGSSTLNKMKDGSKAKWKAEAKICAAILQERKTMKKQKAKTLRLSYYKNMR